MKFTQDALHLINNLQHFSKIPSFSQNTKSFLQNIHHLLQQTQPQDQIDIQPFREKKKNAPPPPKSIDYLQSTTLKYYLRRFWHQSRLYYVELEDRYPIWFACPPTVTLSKIQEYVQLVAWWLALLPHLVGIDRTSHCVQSGLSLFFLLTPLQKTMPKVGIPREEHVNTGITSSCPKERTEDAEIMVYRQEEWFKVFMHETLHTFGADYSTFSAENMRIIDQCALRNFSSNKSVNRTIQWRAKKHPNTYEAYTEFWAEWMHCCFCAFLTTSNTSTQFISPFGQFLQVEQKWSQLQRDHVLSRMNVAGWQEQTNLFAYYVLKADFMQHADAFVRWCLLHNGYITPLQFKLTTQNRDAFCRFLEQIQQSIYQREDEDNVHTTSLRMIACEFR